jgi:hypothetical protein
MGLVIDPFILAMGGPVDHLLGCYDAAPESAF